jgi:hypothetical protein
MKKLLTFILMAVLSSGAFAQGVPEQMSYQAVVRNSASELLINKQIGIKVRIVKGTSDVYTETFKPMSNDNGLITFIIGTGSNTSGDFSTIDWSTSQFYLETDVDLLGGTNYTIKTRSSLLSVPYALYAKTADSIAGGITESDPVFKTSDAFDIKSSDIAYWNKKQDLVIAGTGVTITGDVISIDTSESDPIFKVSVASKITQPDVNDWDNKQDKISAGTGITINGNTISATGAKNKPFFLGKDTLGGIVYYIYLDSLGNQHGLIVSKTQGGIGNLKWSAYTNVLSTTSSWNGASNFALIPQTSLNYQAGYWVKTNLGSGWYLPSVDELLIMYNNRYHINKALDGTSWTPLSMTYRYWASTEYGTKEAWTVIFYNGDAQPIIKTNNSGSFRGVKSF